MPQPISKPVLDAEAAARKALGVALFAVRVRVIAVYPALRALVATCRGVSASRIEHEFLTNCLFFTTFFF